MIKNSKTKLTSTPPKNSFPFSSPFGGSVRRTIGVGGWEGLFIILGILCGLLLPAGFAWLYLYNFYPNDLSFVETIKELWGSPLFGKLLLLAIVPDLVATFIFYKQDSFKIGAGVILGMTPYLIISILMLS